MLSTLWNYRHFIRGVVTREIQSQYSKSLLGTLWIIMNPLYMCIIYSSIFSSLMTQTSSKQSYTIYLAAGLLAWNFFIDILNRSQAIYPAYANIIKQHRFPLLCLSVIVLILASLDFFVSFGLFVGYLIATHAFPGWCFLALFPVLLLQAIYALTLGTLLGIMNLFFRDIGKGLTIFLQIWFWMTPIVYYTHQVPETLQILLSYNPLTSLMRAYQMILVDQTWPMWQSLVFPLLLTLFLMGFFLWRYQQHAMDILDEF